MKALAAILAALVLTGLSASTALACGDGEFQNVLRESSEDGPVAVPEGDAIIIQADVYTREDGDGGAALTAPQAIPEETDILHCDGALCLPYFWLGLL